MLRKLVVVLLTGVMCLVGVTSALAVKYNEAPMLRVKVAAGELPLVEERLPDEPKVVEPVEEIGQYGGTLHTFAINNLPWQDLTESPEVGSAWLLEMTMDGEIVPDLAKGYELSDDAKSLTLYLRKGAKWSDGYPFTADDVVFMFEDLHWNDKVETWNVIQEVRRVKKIDDYTVRFEMDEPFPGILVKMVTWMGSEWISFQPKHYLKKWHIKYNPDANELAKKEGFDNWWECFHYHHWYVPATDINKPTMMPWRFEQFTDTVKVFERNPYFYQVDKEGNQLPYVDRIISTISNVEVYQMKVIAGEADVAVTQTLVENYPLYKENEEKGGYKVAKVPGIAASTGTFFLNQNHPDPFLRGIFQDVRFRQALSLAINREEINNMVFFGLGVPTQATALPSCTYYKEEWGKAYAQYDPAEANRLLDEVGLTERDKDGFRTGPDGKSILLLVERTEIWKIPVTIFELVAEYWKDIGLKVRIKTLSHALFDERCAALDHVIVAHPFVTTGEVANYASPGRGLPGNKWCPAWAAWLSANEAVRTGRQKLEDFKDGKLPGEEPPEEIKQVNQWVRQRSSTRFGSKEYRELSVKIYDFIAEKLYSIGTVGLVPQLYIAKKDIGNIPKVFPLTEEDPSGLFNEAQQLFWKQ